MDEGVGKRGAVAVLQGRHSPARVVLRQVLADLPTSVARRLDEDEVASVVQALLSLGWRPAQLGARIGVLPASDDPGPQVLGFRRALTGEESPEIRVSRERAERATATGLERAGAPQPASAAARDRWISQVRQGLTGTPRRRADPIPRTRPACAVCQQDGSFFVTHEVHLCRRCVAVLQTGQARLEAAG